MKIKTKLTLNVVIVLIIIVAVAATSFVGMGFVKSRLLYLTQKSTPFQMRTVEFQRAIMGATADLIKVSSSRAQEDFAAFNSEAGKSIAEVKEAQEAIEQLSGGEIIETYNDMKKISDEILQVTAERLRAEAEAKAASLLINQRLQEMSVKLGDLDARIHALQLRSSKAFIGSVEDTSAISKQLRHLEILRANLKDLQIAFMDFHRSQEKRALIMSRSKVNTLFARIMQEDVLRESKKQAGDLQALASKAEELIKLRMTADADVKAVEILAKDVDERLSVLLITLEQDVMAAREKASLEGDRQSGLMGESNISANVLAMNSELIETGLSIEGLSTRLFTLFSEKDVAVVEAQLRKTFDKVPNAMNVLQKGLGRLGDKDSLRILKEAETSLDVIKNMLFVQDGVVAKIRKQLSMQEKAEAATGRLRVIVLKQAEKSKESVTAARGEQEKAIGTVNRMVRFSMTLIAVISLASIVFGIVFGIWVYSSISRPLSQLMKVADEVSNGNLAYVIPKSTADEIGVVQTSMAKMVGNLRGIVGKIAASTSLLASSSEELSSTATVIDKGSQEQTRQVEQSATAMTEMSQTTLDVAKNASSTAEDARKMKAVADQGRQAMEGTVSELVKFSETFKIAATRIEALSKKSQEISNVVSLIREIAEQTNLLALNAAIEAAHAGDQGRGFAVVADNVRQLAERTSLATDDIGKTIHAMQEDVDGTVALVKREKEAVGIVLEQVKATMQEIGGIVTNVEHVTDMIQRIAVATDEQSSTSDMVSHSMEGIANVTRQLNNSIEEIKRSAGDLSKLATELNTTAGWFKT